MTHHDRRGPVGRRTGNGIEYLIFIKYSTVTWRFSTSGLCQHAFAESAQTKPTATVVMSHHVRRLFTDTIVMGKMAFSSTSGLVWRSPYLFTHDHFLLLTRLHIVQGGGD